MVARNIGLFHVQISPTLGGCFVLSPPIAGAVRERFVQPLLEAWSAPQEAETKQGGNAVVVVETETGQVESSPEDAEKPTEGKEPNAVVVVDTETGQVESPPEDAEKPTEGKEQAAHGPLPRPGSRVQRPADPHGASPLSEPAGAPRAESSSAAAGPPKAQETCDKCDGKHPTDACPHFKRAREKHKDAWVNYGRKHPKEMGTAGGGFVLRRGQVVPQPGDGSCLFHSLRYGLSRVSTSYCGSAAQLRGELMQFIQANSHLEIAGDTLEEWVRWDSNTSVSTYTRRMAKGGWGGGIEMAACALLKKVNVHVYERRFLGGYRRISCFDCPEQNSSSIHVLYQGAMHYDALVPC